MSGPSIHHWGDEIIFHPFPAQRTDTPATSKEQQLAHQISKDTTESPMMNKVINGGGQGSTAAKQPDKPDKPLNTSTQPAKTTSVQNQEPTGSVSKSKSPNNDAILNVHSENQDLVKIPSKKKLSGLSVLRQFSKETKKYFKEEVKPTIQHAASSTGLQDIALGARSQVSNLAKETKRFYKQEVKPTVQHATSSTGLGDIALEARSQVSDLAKETKRYYKEEVKPTVQQAPRAVRDSARETGSRLSDLTEETTKQVRRSSGLSKSVKIDEAGASTLEQIEAREAHAKKLDELKPIHQAAVNVMHEGAEGIPHTAKEYLEAARSLESYQKVDLTVSTTMLQLYEKAAQTLASEGKIIESFQVRSEASTAVKFNESHSMHKMDEAIQNRTDPAHPEFGAHFSSNDTGVLKKGTIDIHQRVTIDENNHKEKKDFVNFEISHNARAHLAANIDDIQNNLNSFKQSLPQELQNVSIRVEDSLHFQGPNEEGVYSNKDGAKKDYKTYVIEFEGVGKVTLVADPNVGSFYNEVRVELASGQPDGEGVKKIQQMLTVLGVGPITGAQRSEDDQRILMALMFRTYFPKEALKFETEQVFYEMSTAELRDKIIAFTPEMEGVFKHYEENPNLVKKVEVFKGKVVWALGDVAQQMRAEGAYGAMGGVDSFDAAASILFGGALSSKERHNCGINAKGGASPDDDFQTGGGDKIFMRLVNDKNVNRPIPPKLRSKKTGKPVENPLGDWVFSGKVQILYDLEVVNRGAIPYYQDHFGAKNPHRILGPESDPDEIKRGKDYGFYKARDNLVDFTQNLGTEEGIDRNHDTNSHLVEDPNDQFGGDRLKEDKNGGTHNEICIPGGRVDPSYIKGCLVANEEDKMALIAAMKKKGMISGSGDNVKINGQKIPIDEFIHVGNKFQEKHWGAKKAAA